MSTDATGRELTAPQTEIMECYERLTRTLADHSSELAPFEQRNALKALACLWQIANGLDMDKGQIYHLGA